MFHWYSPNYQLTTLPKYGTSLALSLFLPPNTGLNLRRASRNLHLVHTLLSSPPALSSFTLSLGASFLPSPLAIFSILLFTSSIPLILSLHFSVSFRSFP
ncbi:hypothetical protein P168DRAFT_116906 [Aspergillus campestris IBT 28561]|uniref:Uncharacterized protein n=1 Tax=Aspergillus campestris (strain IBT 28561) TaxID=1392248 RepID=A0A2I1D9W4_ASPC2|nr:uncharacterized protein P168DRAFT_116906 [Aspergillus campestris IBT 28561]PKY06673.1 hypothetical protein P168DRAFT_116906 [Aspergillus campestris IBT 28561]